MSIHARTRDRLEDVQFMADCGESAEGAAKRLGLKERALERWLERHDHAALWFHLLNNGRRHTGGCLLAAHNPRREAS